MSEPNLLLLGPLRAVAAEGQRAVTGHAGRLLVELVVAGPVLSRERLADALWGDEPPRSGDAALRVHLARLRRLLEDTPITIERRGSALELVGATTDIEACERSVRAAHDARTGSPTWAELDAAAELLAVAAGRWRGQPFSPYDDEPALASSVHRVQSLRAEVEELRIDLALDRGRHRTAIADLERTVADEPFREGAWARLMVALYRDGRQREALAAYSSARSLLVEQLGVEPGPELQHRHAQVLAQDPELDWRPPAEAVDRSPPIPTGIRSDRSDALIGRDKQFDATVASIADHRLVTVCGPPGIGKSALVGAVCDAALVEPVVVDLDRTATAGSVPLAVADAIGLRPDPSDGLDPLPLVVAALTDADVIVVLDGGDRLGPGVPELAAALLEACPDVRILAARRSPLALGAEVVIDLPLLERSDALALLVQLIDAGTARSHGHGAVGDTESSLERVAAAADGHPLSLQLAAGWIALLGADVVAAQLEAGELPIASDPEQPFVEQVEVSLRTVDAAVRDAFVSLAAFAGGFDIEAVAAVAGLSGRDAARVVRDLHRIALLEPGQEPGRWHLLAAVRDAAWEIAEREGRRDTVLARHEAFLVEKLAPWRSPSFGFDGPGVVEALTPWRADLRHLYERRIAAGDLDGVADLVDGLYWFWDAAGLRQEAATLLEQALALAADQPDHPELGLIRSLHSSIGGTFAWQAEHLDEAAQGLVESERHGHALGIFSAHLGLAMGRGWSGDLAAAEEHLELARRTVAAAPPYFGLSIDGYLGIVRLASGDLVEARRLLEQTVAAYDELGSPWGAAHSLTFLGMVAVLEDDPAGARVVFQRTIERAVESGKVQSELHARMEMADLLAASGAEDDALVEYELVTAELLGIGDLGCAGQCLCGWAEVARSLGERESARWLLAEAATIGRRGRDPGVVTRAVTGLAEIALGREDRGEAMALLGALDADRSEGGRPTRPADQERLQRCRSALVPADSAGDASRTSNRPLGAVLDAVRVSAREAGAQPPAGLGASGTWSRQRRAGARPVRSPGRR